MKKALLLACALVLLQACTTKRYTPEEYVIKPGRIDSFELRGDVAVENHQQDVSETKFYDSSLTVTGDYKSVSEHMAWQLKDQIDALGVRKPGGTQKKIGVRVTHLNSETKLFHLNSSLSATVTLGNGKEVSVTVSQGSPSNIWGVLNGTIALGVIEILRSPEVLKYLAE